MGALNPDAFVADSGPDGTDSDEGHEETTLPPVAVSALSDATSKYLTEILASMAELHRPAPRLSNRIRPYDWESVLDVVSRNGLIDNTCVAFIYPHCAMFLFLTF